MIILAHGPQATFFWNHAGAYLDGGWAGLGKLEQAILKYKAVGFGMCLGYLGKSKQAILTMSSFRYLFFVRPNCKIEKWANWKFTNWEIGNLKS